MPITAPPAIPQITDPKTFATRAQDWVVWQANELYPALEDSATVLSLSTSSTSTTSNTIGTGSKSFTVETGKGYLAGQSLSIANTTTPTNRMFAVVTSYNSGTGALVVNVQAIEGSGTFTAWSIALAFNGVISTGQIADNAVTNVKLDSTVTPIGLQTIYIPAGAMIPRTSNGAAFGTLETTTNKVMVRTLDFDTATTEYAQFNVRMPKSWDEGTVTAYFIWSHPATTTNFGVVWGLQGVAISDDDALDVAFGTVQVIADTGGTTNDLYQSAITPAITIGGTPQELDYVTFQIYRDVAAGGDTMAVDARLHGVVLMYSTNRGNDA
jgi:hypothetical protein